MPANSASPNAAAPLPKDASLVRYDEYIDAQIRSTRSMVRTVDLAAALVTLAAGVLAFLLAYALVEHWLVPHGFSSAARFALFAVLIASIGYFTYQRLWPLVSRAINPVYAAQTIEQASPALKNTLINLLLFRQRRADVSDAVYRTLEEQAANRLTRVPTDAAVDRGQLIRLGYVLIAVVAVAAIYKIASPKDPIIAAERVLMPWADIVPASRVKILNVSPGDVVIPRGDFIDITAEVRGISEQDSVVVRQTTADGQAVGKSVRMSAADDGYKFSVRLPDSTDVSGAVGLSQNLTYRIEAGDARSHDFEVTVVSAPAILVERIEYDYPDYTGEPNRTVPGTGDIRAIEGTRVTIHARANGPIDEAFVDFDSDGRRDVRLETQGASGKASFVLTLREDRKTPLNASYSLRFKNAEGRENKNPARFPIAVLRDFDPEIRLLSPREKTLDVRLDESVTIEVDARDPDFALGEVRLRGEAVGRREINVQLLGKPHVGQFNGRYQFIPRDHQLRVGDTVQYWAEAHDNRTPAANIAKTELQTIRIVAPDRPQPQPGERNQPQRGDRGQGQKQPDTKQQQRGPQSNQDNNNQERGEKSSAADSPNDPGANSAEPSKDQPPSQGDRNSSPEDSQQNEGQRGGRGANGLGSAGQDQQQQPDNEQSDKQGGAPQNGNNSSNSNQDDSASNSRGEGARGGNRDSASRRGNDENSRPGSGGQSSDDEKREPSPISPDGDNDSTAFQRIRERLQNSNQLPNEGERRERSDDSTGSKSAADQPPGERDQSQKNNDSKQDASKSPDPSKGASKQPAENRDAPPSRGGNESSTNDPRGNADRPGQDQRTRDQGSKEGADGKREQTPSKSNDAEKNTGAPGRREENSAGDENPDMKGEPKDSAANRQPNRDGAGETGQGESADKGAGQSSERGAGNDSKSAGRDVPSTEKTDQPGENTPGRGSNRRENSNGDSQNGDRGGERSGERGAGKAGDEEKTSPSGEGDSRDPSHKPEPQAKDASANSEAQAKDSSTKPEAQAKDSSASGAANGKSADGKSADGKSQEKSAGKSAGEQQPGDSDAAAGKSGDNATGQRGRGPQSPSAKSDSPASAPGGNTGATDVVPQNAPGQVPDADAANLDYARRQTDLVLERLSDQLNRKQVDRELLKDLGWTEDDLRKFVSRWQQRQEAARANSPAAENARKELDDALRSLGLRPTQPRQAQVRDDQMRDLRPGYRGTIPPEYQERLRAYNRGVSRSRQEAK
jgi:hypothetical protein